MRSGKRSLIFINTHKSYLYLIGVFVVSLLLFRIASMFQETFENLVSDAMYLTWHSLFEFASILVSFAVFVTAYYTYEQTKNLRFIVIGAVFLFMGGMDLFHTLSYKGMPQFFVDNLCCANRATTFWVISRIIGNMGIAIAVFIPQKKKSNINKFFFAIPSIVLSIVFLVIATYYPDLLPHMYIENQGLTRNKIILEYIIIIFISIALIMFMLEYKKTKNSTSVLFAGGLLISIFSEFAFITYTDPYDIHNYIGHIYKVAAFFLIFKGTFIVSVQKPYMDLTAARNKLNEYAENLDRLVSERTKQLKEINAKLLNDLEYARGIQRSMLPQALPQEDNVSFAAEYFPAERVSGDLYNIFKLDNDNIGFYIGDVAGHGVPAAMLTVFLKQSIKTKSEACENNRELLDPSTILNNIYESFNNTNFKDEVYIVMLYGIYNFKTREMVYSSAGLNVSPLIVKKTGEVEEVSLKGFPICKFMDVYPVKYENKFLRMRSGDKVVFYTDGLIEARNTNDEQFSHDRLIGVLKSISCGTAQEVCNTITESVFDFMDISGLRDDITFFVMEIK